MKRIFLIVFLTSFLFSLSYSQSRETSALEGQVTEEQVTEEKGEALPGVQIVISSPNLIGGNQTKITNVQGKYRFSLLPPGNYSIEASVPGFDAQKKENVRLFVGQTLTVDFALKMGGLSNEITVQAVSPLIDVKDSQLGTTQLDETKLTNVIYSRDFYAYSVIDLTPGTTPVYHGSAALGGTARTGNAYEIDGVEVSQPISGGTWTIPDSFIFEEMKVQGLGASAEYYGFQGLLLSMVTKSGGNEFEGFAQLAFQGWGWQNENFDPSEKKFSFIKFAQGVYYLDPHFSLGGPIFKDKLWFFTSLRYKRLGFEYAGQKWDRPMHMAFIKLTFQPFKSTRLGFFTEYDDDIYDYRYQDVYRPKEASSYEHVNTWLQNLSAFHSFTGTTFLEFKVAIAKNWDRYGSMLDNGRNISGRRDAQTGKFSVNYKDWEERVNYRFQVNSSLTHHADDFLGGSHDFKVGAEFEEISNDQIGNYNGRFFYVDNVYSFADHKFHNYAYETSFHQTPKGHRYSLFAQDAWKVSERLVINPGLRLGILRGKIASVDKMVYRTWYWEPRIGITWDVFGDHKTALKAHYGRFHDKFNCNQFSAADVGQADFIQYEVRPDGSKVEIFRTNYSTPATVDPNIKQPYMDQFALGLERELMKDMSGSLVFVYKKFGAILFRVNSGATYVEKSFTITDDKGETKTIIAYNKTSPSSGDKFLVTNPKAGLYSSVPFTPQRAYSGIIFQVEKRFSNRWMLSGSYTLSWTTATSTNIDPNIQLNFFWEGEPVVYPFHNFKINGHIVLPLDIKFSPTFSYWTGPRWTRNVIAPVKGNPSRDIEKAGSNKMHDVINFDFRIEKNFNVYSDVRIGAYFDLYNALNLGYETSVVSRITNPNFGLADAVNLGRQLQIGLRIYF